MAPQRGAFFLDLCQKLTHFCVKDVMSIERNNQHGGNMILIKNLIIFSAILTFLGSAVAMENSSFVSLDAEKVLARELPDLKNINWQVGEYQNRRIKKGFAKVGTLKSWVDRDEGAAFWLINEIKVVLQKKKIIEVLIDRATGEILTYIEDGVEKDAPDTTQLEECQEISEVQNSVKVPAGDFDATRTVLRCPDESVAIWINHNEVNMGGHVKQALLGQDEDPDNPDYKIELEEFGKQ